jgi:hypothetical protein
MTDQESPKCQGRKIIIGLFPLYAEHVPKEKRKPTVELPCPTCQGVGRITNRQANQLRGGEILRERRKAKGYGLRECSEAIGKEPSLLSEAEQGRHNFLIIDALDAAIRELPQRKRDDQEAP